MLKNKYLHRTGARAGSAMVIRNGYPKQLGVQYYVVVEGESDEHFFENLLDLSKCKISNLKGKENVKNFIEKQNKANKHEYLGIVDADFEHIIGYEKEVDNIILTDYHDIEMLILSSKPNMRRIYSEMNSNRVINEFETKYSKKYIDAIIDAAYEIGILKMIMKKPYYSVDMKNIAYVDIINNKFEVNIDELIRRVKKRHHTLYEIKDDISIEKKKGYDKFQVCCGHDVTSILAISFTDKEHEGLGYGKKRDIRKEKIEEMLRMIYSLEHFSTTNIYFKILEWEKKNKIGILDRNIFKVA